LTYSGNELYVASTSIIGSIGIVPGRGYVYIYITEQSKIYFFVYGTIDIVNEKNIGEENDAIADFIFLGCLDYLDRQENHVTNIAMPVLMLTFKIDHGIVAYGNISAS